MPKHHPTHLHVIKRHHRREKNENSSVIFQRAFDFFPLKMKLDFVHSQRFDCYKLIELTIDSDGIGLSVHCFEYRAFQSISRLNLDMNSCLECNLCLLFSLILKVRYSFLLLFKGGSRTRNHLFFFVNVFKNLQVTTRA